MKCSRDHLILQFASYLAAMMAVLASPSDAAEALDLSGEWGFALDPKNAGVSEGWFNRGLPDRVRLPGCLQEQGFGNKPGPDTVWWVGWTNRGRLAPEFPFLARYHTPTNFKSFAFLLPDRHYIGAAWFAREIEILPHWQGQHISLHLERCHWETRVWVDGESAGRNDGLAVAHRYDLSRQLSPGHHRLAVRVDNGQIADIGGNCHAGSDQTAGTWNGIVGPIELRASPAAWIDDVQVFPNVARKTARGVITIRNRLAGSGEGTLTIEAQAFNSTRAHRIPPQRFDAAITGEESLVEADFPLGADAQLWDEFSPTLYRLKIRLNCTIGDRGADDTAEVTFGLREFTTQGTRFALNGRPVFLRGNVDCAVFPKTGYAPMDVASWRRVWRTHKEFGFNFVRFHSWCPPEAAFDAADEEGLLLAPEVSEWSYVSTRQQEDFFRRESAAMLRQFGNHPSFVMMALGNEIGGKKDIFTRLITEWQKDRRRVYSIKANSAANPPEVDYETQLAVGKDRLRYQEGWPPGPSNTVFHTRPPQTEVDWRAGVSRSAKPLVAHETGQFCAFPDVLNEPARFTGYLKPSYLDIVRDTLTERGLLAQVPEFVRASGEWQKRLYKEEIESHLRTPGLAGFGLLQLNDFTGQDTALVGLCDAFYEPKPYVKPAEFRRFNASTVVLARMPRRVWTDDQTFSADVELSHFGPQDRLRLTNLTATIRDADGKVMFTQPLPAGVFTRTDCQPAGRVATGLKSFPSPANYLLEVETPDGALRNDWEFWVFPKTTLPEPSNTVHIAHVFDAETRDMLSRGLSVLLLPKLDDIRGRMRIAFTTLYWTQFGFEGGQSSGNGILLDPKHPAFAAFPTEFHTNWQWWDLLTRCRPMILDEPDAQHPWPKAYRPLVQLIDGWKTNRKLALLLEARVGPGRLAICSMDLETDLANRPVARQFRRSLLRYVNSPAFNPTNAITLAQIAEAFEESRTTPASDRP